MGAFSRMPSVQSSPVLHWLHVICADKLFGQYNTALVHGWDLEQFSFFCPVIVSYLLSQHGNKVSELDILHLVFDHGLLVQASVYHKVWLLVNSLVCLRGVRGQFDLVVSCVIIHLQHPFLIHFLRKRKRALRPNSECSRSSLLHVLWVVNGQVYRIWPHLKTPPTTFFEAVFKWQGGISFFWRTQRTSNAFSVSADFSRCFQNEHTTNNAEQQRTDFVFLQVKNSVCKNSMNSKKCIFRLPCRGTVQ